MISKINLVINFVNEISNIDLKIDIATKNFDTKKVEINKYINEKFYNYIL